MGLKAGKGKALKIKFDYPDTLPDGAYFVLAVIDAGAADVNGANNAGATTVATMRNTHAVTQPAPIASGGRNGYA